MNVRKKVPESMCSDPDPKVRRKLLDLKIANNSLLTLNASLNETIKTQSSKLSSLTSFESMKNVQQLQHDHIAKVEELMRELTGKFSSQELEIKNLKNSLEDKHSKQQQKTRVSLFYDSRNLPINSLPSIICNRVVTVYEDITIIFSVVVSLIYTIYILPIIVTAKTAKLLADKSRARIMEITG